MKYNHELIVPDEGLPFKMFILRARMAIISVRCTGIVLWRFLRSVRGNFVSISKRSRILLCRENL